VQGMPLWASYGKTLRVECVGGKVDVVRERYWGGDIMPKLSRYRLLSLLRSDLTWGRHEVPQPASSIRKGIIDGHKLIIHRAKGFVVTNN
jgi:hypothetical protein